MAEQPNSETTKELKDAKSVTGVEPWETTVKRLTDLSPFISYLEKTSPDEWQVDTVRSVGNTKNCVMGHLVNWYYGKDWQGSVSPVWDWFEEMWATTYMIYPVNDGGNPKYKQPTARERVIAYLKDLRDGKEKTSVQLWEEGPPQS